MKTVIAKSGQCLRCARTTEWTAHEGWVFHTVAKHWRCTVCTCATEPHLFLNHIIVAKIQKEEARRLLEQEG